MYKIGENPLTLNELWDVAVNKEKVVLEENTKKRIKEWYEHFDGEVYVSFSGGKDSTVLLDMAREMHRVLSAIKSG